MNTISLIKIIQLDPFSYCNNKCWYCPVRYYPQQTSEHMSIELLRKIIKNIVTEKGNLVSDKFDFVYEFGDSIAAGYYADNNGDDDLGGFIPTLKTALGWTGESENE